MQKLTSTIFSAALLLGASSLHADDKLAKDRAAILAMAGDYYVDFQFKETVALDSGYKLKKPYTSDASETVKVIKNTDTCIVMQHLLLNEETGVVIKHWKQEWNYQDTDIHEFAGNRIGRNFCNVYLCIVD